VFSSFNEAVADCSVVVGTSGKREVGSKTQMRHFVYPWEFSERISSQTETVALVFGEEGKGLAEEDLLNCDYLVTLPTWEGYPITNLSHAVHTLTYELHRNRVISNQGKEDALPSIVPLERGISAEQRIVLRKAIMDISKNLPGGDERKKSFGHSMIRSLQRSGLLRDEANRMIGGLVDSATALAFASGNDEWRASRRRKVIREEE
jgi:TrmH family RNA methyltransferase